MSKKCFEDLSKRRKRDILKKLVCNDEMRILDDIPNDVGGNISEKASCSHRVHNAEYCELGEVMDHEDQADDENLLCDNEEIIQESCESEDEEQDNVDENIGQNDEYEQQHHMDNDYDQIDEDEGDEEDEGVDNVNEDDNEHDRPLYTGAPLTISQSMMLIMTIFISHNMTQSCLADMLTVLNMHCLNDGLRRHSLYKFKKFFNPIGNNCNDYIKHYYCSVCKNNLKSSKDVCSECPYRKTKKVSYFLELSIINQMRELYKREDFYEKLQHRFQRPNFGTGLVRDLYDGNLYRTILDEGHMNGRNDISFTWYTDGIPVYKSTRISMWPIYLSINELPFKDRTKRHNLILAGLWFGPKKPDANNYFYQFREQFRILKRGKNFTLSNGQEIFVKSILLAGTCDLPAKSQFLNLTQFNGEYGCPSCLSPGESYRLQSGGVTHVYRYTENIVMRTSDQCEEYAHRALENGKPVMGVRGISSLSRLMPDFIVGTAIDRMHCIDGGVVKKLLSLWFEPANRSLPFSMVDVVDIVNQRLIAIKPPKFIHRMPRSIEELCHWKASELKTWFFYYSVPVLSGIMRPDYVEHLLLLITGVALLNTDTISNTMINNAANLLSKFVREFEVKYSLQFSSINIHLIQHLPECVKNLGPLWAYSCYPYEDFNGKLLNMVHGTWHIDSQIASRHGQQLKMQHYLNQLPAGPIREFCLGQRRGVKICEKICDSCYSVGTYKNVIEPLDLINNAIEYLLPLAYIRSYQRLIKDEKLYVSEQYGRELQTSSSCVAYENLDGCQFGSILCFLKTSNCQCMNAICDCNSQHYAIVQTFKAYRPFEAKGDNNIVLQLPYMFKCRREDNYIAVPIQCLISVCFQINVDDNMYIALPINSKEYE